MRLFFFFACGRDTERAAPRMGERESMAEWLAVREHYETIREKEMAAWFAADPERSARLSLQLFVGDVLLDYSKNCDDDEAMARLVALVRACGVESMRDRMFAGDPINQTEGRAVLHVALRVPPSASSEGGAARWPPRQ